MSRNTAIFEAIRNVVINSNFSDQEKLVLVANAPSYFPMINEMTSESGFNPSAKSYVQIFNSIDWQNASRDMEKTKILALCSLVKENMWHRGCALAWLNVITRV